MRSAFPGAETKLAVDGSDIGVQVQMNVGNEVQVWGDTKDGMPRNGAAGARERSGMGRFLGANAEVSGVKGLNCWR